MRPLILPRVSKLWVFLGTSKSFTLYQPFRKAIELWEHCPGIDAKPFELGQDLGFHVFRDNPPATFYDIYPQFMMFACLLCLCLFLLSQRTKISPEFR